MALYVAADFSGYSATYAVPSDYVGTIFNGSVDLILNTTIKISKLRFLLIIESYFINKFDFCKFINESFILSLQS